MAEPILTRVPVVGALGYSERLADLPASFTATLAVEPGNRYFLQAIVVLANGEKVGYVAPEAAADVYESIAASPEPVTCPCRRAAPSDHQTSGVELLLDFSSVAFR